MGTLHCIWDLLNCVPLGTEIVTESDSARIPHETVDAKRFKRWGPKHIMAGYIRLYIHMVIWCYMYMVKYIYIYIHTYIYTHSIYIYRYICLHHWKGFIFFPAANAIESMLSGFSHRGTTKARPLLRDLLKIPLGWTWGARWVESSTK